MASSSGTFTYWSLLGLPPGSSADQIKGAFRREARRWHPDLNANNRNAEERFKWINEAYLVLNDPQKRFEWEVAGRPTFQIEELSELSGPACNQTSQEKSNAQKFSDANDSFNPAEKLMLLLISFTCLFLVNNFLQ